jgi:hypothetical protein
MNHSTLSPELQQRLAIVVPIVALLISLFVVYPAWGRYTTLQARIEKQKKELAAQQKDLTALRARLSQEAQKGAATVEDQPAELPEFMQKIRDMARRAHCGIEDLTVPRPPKPDAGVVQVLEAHVELEGSYPQIRDFLSRLNRGPRLSVVANFSLVGSVPQTQPGKPAAAHRLRAAIDIERFVAPRYL